MKKITSFLTALLLSTASLFAQDVLPEGYISKGAFSESFTDVTSLTAIGWGWSWQDGNPSKSYSTSSYDGINGNYISCTYRYLQTNQTTPTLLITPMLKGKVKFYIRPNGYGSDWSDGILNDKQSWVQIYLGHPDENGIVWDENPYYTRLFTTEKPETSNDKWWTQDSLTIEDEYAFIGIQLSYAYFDELTAEDHCLPIKRILTPTEITSEWSDNNPLYGDTEGKATWTGSVTVRNDGDKALSETERVLKIESSNSNTVTTTMSTYTIPDAIEPGESKTYTLEIPLQLTDLTTDGRTAIRITSNIDNVNSTLPYKQSNWFTIKAYAPKLVVRNAKANKISDYVTDLGLIQAPASTTFTLSNEGGSPLVVKSITSATLGNLIFTCDGIESETIFPLTIKQGENTVITMTFGNTGGQSGTLVVTYGNNYDNTEYTLQSKEVSVVVADPNIYLEQFASKLPIGWVNEEGSNWSIASSGINYYMKNGLQEMPGKYLISPKLHFDAGQTLAIMAQRCTNDSKIRVLTSPDRVNWTEAKYIDTWTKNYASYLNTNYTELVITDMPEGDVYVAFESGYALIDYIMGGTRVDVEDDFYPTLSAPEKGMVNYAYTMNLTFENLTETAYEEKALTLELANGDEVVATDTLGALAGGATMNDIALTFTPHAAAEEAVLTLNLKKGERILLSLSKRVNIAEEAFFTDITTGEVTTAESRNIPLQTNYYNSKSEFIYPAEKLNIEAGTKLNSITFYYKNTSKEITADTLRILLQNTDASEVTNTFTAETEMTAVVGIKNYVFHMVSTFEELTFTFDTPFEYTGGNLRVMMVSEKQDVYGITSWATESTSSNTTVYKYSDNYDTYNNTTTGTLLKELPVVKIGYEAAIPAIAGGITLADGSPAEAGKHIVAKSGDVVYETVSETGHYNLPILQPALTYALYMDGELVKENIVLTAETLIDNTLTINITAQSTETGMESTEASGISVRKILIDNQLYILRGETLYHVNGQKAK